MSTRTRTSPANDHRRKPRKKRAPSARDQAILLAYRTRGRTQEELAKEHKLSQRRVSQIVERVERWRADLIPAAENQLDHAQRQRLERELERERLQAIYSRSIRDYDRTPGELTTKRSGERGDKKFHEETMRQIQPNVQLLKTALRASEDLGKLADKEPPPGRRDEEWERWERRHIMRTELCNLRREAEEEGRVVRSKEEEQTPVWTVESWLDALVGNRDNRPSQQNTLPGTPLAELADFCSPWEADVPPAELEDNEALVPSVPPGNALPRGSSLAGQATRQEPRDSGFPGGSLGTRCEPADPVLSNSSNLSNLTAAAEPAAEEQPAAAEPRRARRSPFPSFEEETTSSFFSRIRADKSLTPDQRMAAIDEFKKRDQRRRLLVNTLVLDGVPPALAEQTERRMAHDEKLEQLKAARRRGLPCQIPFDSADGPIPPTSFQLDDLGHIPTPPPTHEDGAQMVQEYLAKLRGENEANRS